MLLDIGSGIHYAEIQEGAYLLLYLTALRLNYKQ